MRWIALGLALTAFGQKPPTESTRAANARARQQMAFDDARDFEEARRGRIAGLPDGGVVRDAAGNVVWTTAAFDFIRPGAAAPESVHPGLWRQSQLMSITGLFKVADRIYQVRGYGISVITFIEGDTGVIVVDPLLSLETARAAADLYFAHRPRQRIKAVIYTHSHADHYGGVKGIVSDDEVRLGAVRVFAPEGFVEETMSESLLAGNAMSRRAGYMFGTFLPRGPLSMVGDGLDLGMAGGQRTLILPTDVIHEPRETKKIDGLTFEFQNTPGTEAPAEMHFYIREFGALCTAENATHTLHNFYTLRGAKTRDTKKWVGFLDQTISRWGDRAEVLFAPHHWPVWGQARILEHLTKYRDTVAYIHDQTLRLANEGYTMTEIAERIELPPALAANASSHGYYGSVSHNSKAVYNYYLGYFDGNPAHLNPLPPVEAARRYVEFMGGADDVLRKSRDAFARGEYRWVAECVNHVVLAFPENRAARELQADALEQLGYQAESGPWRNFYLTGAKELREGVRKSAVSPSNSPDVIGAMPVGLLLDYVAIQLNGTRAAGKQLDLVFAFTDAREEHRVRIDNAVLHHSSGGASSRPECRVELTRARLAALLADHSNLAGILVEGRREVFDEFLSLLDTFPYWFDIVTR